MYDIRVSSSVIVLFRVSSGWDLSVSSVLSLVRYVGIVSYRVSFSEVGGGTSP